MSGRSYEIPSFRRLLRLVGAAFVLCFASVNAAVAATSLSGNLTDPDGGVVPGATVRLLRRAEESTASPPNSPVLRPSREPLHSRTMTSGPRGSNFPTSLY